MRKIAWKTVYYLAIAGAVDTILFIMLLGLQFMFDTVRGG